MYLLFATAGRPFTGAWIETSNAEIVFVSEEVAPSRGRGLKRAGVDVYCTEESRPFTGAWIETSLSSTPTDAPDASPLHGGVD